MQNNNKNIHKFNITICELKGKFTIFFFRVPTFLSVIKNFGY